MDLNNIDKSKIKRIKVDQDQIEKLSDSLDNAFQIAEDALIIEKNIALSKNAMANDYEAWKKAKIIDGLSLQKNLSIAKENIKGIINDSVRNVLVGFNGSLKDLAPELKGEVGHVKIFEFTNHALDLASKKIMSDYERSVAKVYKLRNQEPLYDAILKQSNEGLENGIKIAYKDGRQMSFKSYMEMNMRTTVRQESNEMLFKAAKNNGVVVYACNFYGDSADDHKDFQGRYYFDENWKSFGYDAETSKKIETLIKRYKMVSYQSVVDNPPYLTTRPNCRHVLRPVPLDDFFTKTPKEFTEEYGMRKGTYKDDKYKLTQQQRYNERMIRKYKTRLANDVKMQKNMNSPSMAAQIKHDRQLVTGWEARQRKLIKENPFLKRDYRRETEKVVVFDAGQRYHKGMDLKDNKVFFEKKSK